MISGSFIVLVSYNLKSFLVYLYHFIIIISVLEKHSSACFDHLYLARFFEGILGGKE